VSLKLLLEQPTWVAVDKPPGIPVIPGRTGEGPCVRDVLREQLKRDVWVVHRLDRDTSGVLLFALDAPTHRTLSMAFEGRDVKKQYLALVEGRVEKALDLDFPLETGRKGRMRVGPKGKAARTLVEPVEVFAKASLVACEPLTGRTHQIRVHLSHAGHPLLFDHQYQHGEQSTLIARTPLHAVRVEWNGLVVESELPEDMRNALASLRGGSA
jgi:tRNA pseudouridine32 synthase/23S rRNA pseudouridine746 synthase/23S rRNA pseudouridine955/2504/2580 synthase